MPTLTITIDLSTEQAAKLKEAIEYATKRTLTFAEAEEVVREWTIRHLRHEAKSYLADKRRAQDAETDNDLIDQIVDPSA